MNVKSLRAAQRLAGMGSWEWDAKADVVSWSAELYRLFGVDPATPAPSFAEHPDWFSPEGWQVLQAAVERALGAGENYRIEVEYRDRNGDGGWMELRGEPIRDDSGNIAGLRGTAMDITVQRATQHAEIDRRVLQRARDERMRFLRKVSEDIRNSLNAVIGCAHLLRSGVAGDAQQERWAVHILAASDQILGLLSEMEESVDSDPAR